MMDAWSDDCNGATGRLRGWSPDPAPKPFGNVRFWAAQIWRPATYLGRKRTLVGDSSGGLTRPSRAECLL